MKQTVGSTGTMSRRMQQQELPFERFDVGWRGKRYLLCTDGMWHLVLEIGEGYRADTQCCEDTQVVLPVPNGSPAATCETCLTLQATVSSKQSRGA